jgi:hypothetical protein
MLVGAAQIGKHRRRNVARLFNKRGIVNGTAVDARRCSGLEPRHGERQVAQPLGQRIGGWIPGSPAFVIGQPRMNSTTEEGSRGKHDRSCPHLDARLCHDTRHPIALNDQIDYRLLKYLQMGLVL